MRYQVDFLLPFKLQKISYYFGLCWKILLANHFIGFFTFDLFDLLISIPGVHWYIILVSRVMCVKLIKNTYFNLQTSWNHFDTFYFVSILYKKICSESRKMLHPKKQSSIMAAEEWKQFITVQKNSISHVVSGSSCVLPTNLAATIPSVKS